MKLIKQWDDAVKKVGKPDQVDAMTILEDGSIRFELLHKGEVK